MTPTLATTAMATSPATAWFALALVLAAFAYGTLPLKWSVFALLPAALAAALCIAVSLGKPLTITPPPGHYAVVGVKIDVNEAIYVLLDSGSGAPVYYRMPYSTSKANELQNAMDVGEGGVSAVIGTDGGVSYDGDPPVHGDEAKVPEAPEVNIGG